MGFGPRSQQTGSAAVFLKDAKLFSEETNTFMKNRQAPPPPTRSQVLRVARDFATNECLTQGTIETLQGAAARPALI